MPKPFKVPPSERRQTSVKDVPTEQRKPSFKEAASKRRQPSAKDVAQLAGVSRSAVSRTFTEGGSVSPATRAKVLKAAETLGYHVNHLARGLSKEESRPVCILVSTLRKPYHAQLLDRVTLALQAAGRIAIIINVGDQPGNAEKALEQTLNYRAAASVVLSGSPPDALVRQCVKAGQKVILINRAEDLPNVHHVKIDYDAAMRQTAALFQKAGCGRVAIVSRRHRTPSLAARGQLLQEALAELGIAIQLWDGPSTSYEAGQLAARDLLLGAETPDGVFCVNDLLAFGLIDVARQEFGLSLPSDLCVLGFDDVAQAAWASYDLTTYTQPYEDIAEAVAQIISDAPSPASTRLLSPQLAWRGTMRTR